MLHQLDLLRLQLLLGLLLDLLVQLLQPLSFLVLPHLHNRASLFIVSKAMAVLALPTVPLSHLVTTLLLLDLLLLLLLMLDLELLLRLQTVRVYGGRVVDGSTL